MPRKLAAAYTLLFIGTSSALASPWAEVGDAQLRSDVDLLAAAGVIDNITMQWPLAWGGVLNRLDGDWAGLPDFIRDAALRVRTRGLAETQAGALRTTASFDAASTPNFIRGFDALGRETVQGQVGVEYIWSSTAVHLALGAKSTDKRDRQVVMPDGSYVAQRIGNAAVYAGYMTHWWGPGWISAMSLSNNARPVPQVGITRISTTPFDSPWLSWIGPW